MKTKYIRLLTYEQACNVIDFVNKEDNKDYANIVVGGVSVQSENFKPIEDYINEREYRHHWSEEKPHKVTEGIIDDLKKRDII